MPENGLAKTENLSLKLNQTEREQLVESLIKKGINFEIANSIVDFADSTTQIILKRAKDIHRDKIYAVSSFFLMVKREADQITIRDINDWHQWMLDEGKTKKRTDENGITKFFKTGLEESTIYTRLSHLSAYFEWLRKLPEFAHFIKSNPVRLAMPKPPKKYNSAKAKALTDEELSRLWLHLENLTKDDKNLKAIRDYAIFRIFTATGMRREEVLGLNAGDVKLTSEGLLIRALIKGGHYEWRIISDEEVIEAFERYLTLSKRKSTIGDRHRALWARMDRGAKIALYDNDGNKKEIEPGLTSKGFEKQIKIYAHYAGIGHFHIHQFRHTFARIVAEDSGSIIETQDALGHANIQTTQVYVKRIVAKKDKHSQNIRKRIQTIDIEALQQSDLNPTKPENITAVEKPTAKIKIITLSLSIENNSKFVRGKGKVRESIEWFMLRELKMKKLLRNDYELTFSYKDEEHLQKQIDDLQYSMALEADLRNCYIETSFYDRVNDIYY